VDLWSVKGRSSSRFHRLGPNPGLGPIKGVLECSGLINSKAEYDGVIVSAAGVTDDHKCRRVGCIGQMLEPDKPNDGSAELN
jgi:hypothetical protein